MAIQRERYKAVKGSESGHCCFEATVVDTQTPHPMLASDHNWVCECFDMEDAQKIADALNAAEPVKVRPETLSEHIARDMREGRFPDKSERKMVPAEPVKRKRRYAQGTALGEFGVAPMCDQVDD